MFAYASAKHGVVGSMRSAANAYAPQRIRVNSVHPSGVATPMILNDYVVNRMMEEPEPGHLGDLAARRAVGRVAGRSQKRCCGLSAPGPGT